MAKSKRVFVELSWTQRKMLEQVRDGECYDAHVCGVGAAGAVGQTLRSLKERRYLVETDTQIAITSLGRVALEEIRKQALHSK